ncbi:alcohol oxidase-like protein [Ganoderma leucocontextum]|nr:alcohol oxidase-like protein [Ganoderma leucocontextum]
MTSPQLFDQYDIIIAGSGTAGGVILGRPAMADPSLRISHIQPARYLTHLEPDSNTVKHAVGKPSDHPNGRQLAIQCGQCVGGGSRVGCMRPPASDNDDWANVHDNPSWSFDDLLPLIKRAETYHVATGKPSHGYDGPLKVSYGGARTNVGEDYIQTISQYDKTRAAVVDDASSMTLMDLNHRRRSDVAHDHIHPALDGKSRNVHLLPGCAVRKVIVEDGKATGVEYVLNSKVLPDADNTPRTARATKPVVLSAGAFGSPTILERSGIGSKGILERNGIRQTVVELPGVGENYSDHPLIMIPFHAKEDADTLHGIVQGDPGEHEKWSAKWHEDGQGLMGSNGLDGTMHYRPSSEQEVGEIGAEFAERWASFYAGAPDKPVMLAAQLSGYIGAAPPPASHNVYSAGAHCSYPLGTGSVHITSAHDVDLPVDFDTGVLKRKEDLAVMRHAWKLCREYGRRIAAAASPNHNTPVPTDAPDIVYTEEDDRAIDDLGTCAMRSRDKGGVVDSRLDVYGVQNLKVADLSICPSIVAANACSTAVLVGEKAAVIVAEEIGIAGV